MPLSNTQLPSSHTDVNWNDEPNFVNADGLHIYCRYWQTCQTQTENKPKALVFIQHGVCEHSFWYDTIAKQISQQNLLVCAHDLVGHGLSQGDRVYVESMSVYVRDLIQHIDIVQKKHGPLPVYLIGHSMGGTIVLKAGLDHPQMFKGIVLIAPAIEANPETATWFKVKLARIMAWLMPQFQVGKLETEWMCRDLSVQERYKADPLNWHGGLKARLAVSMLDTFVDIQSRFADIKWPFFVLHGDEDKLCLFAGSEKMYKEAASEDKAFKIFKGGYHSLHNEPDGKGEECMDLITKWLTDRA